MALSIGLAFDFLLFRIRRRFYTKNMLKRHQLTKAKAMARYASENSSFFKKYYEGHDVSNFFSLPFLNKEIMMDNLSEYNTLNLDKRELVQFALDVESSRDFSKRFKGVNIGMSSGTSGNKSIIITTVNEEDYIKTMYVSRLIMPKGEKLNCAFILRVSSPAFNYDKNGNRLTYITQLQPIELIVGQLNTLNPNVLAGPPSMLKLLALEKQKGSLNINPKILYVYAEVFYPDIRKVLEDVFKSPIHQVYQGSEGFYALTCKHGNLHINEDMTLMELFDKDGNPAKDGEPCFKLVVTDLHKKAQPIIRYEIDDIITISKEKCRCGSNFRIIENIQGRADDMFWGLRKDTKKPHFIFQDYIARTIISASESIQEYQAIQESYRKVTLRILYSKSDKKNISKILSQRIKKVFADYGCLEPSVNVIFGQPLLNERSNKLIRIICKIKGEKH